MSRATSAHAKRHPLPAEPQEYHRLWTVQFTVDRVWAGMELSQHQWSRRGFGSLDFTVESAGEGARVTVCGHADELRRYVQHCDRYQGAGLGTLLHEHDFMRRFAYERTRAGHRPLPVDTLVFDGDDTLWETETLHDAAKEHLVEIMTSAGFPADLWVEILRGHDIDGLPRYGFGPDRFQAAVHSAYAELTSRCGRPMQMDILTELHEASTHAYFTPVAPFPRAHQVLRGLRPSHRIVVLTKGDEAVQFRRFNEARLRPVIDDIVVVDDKSKYVFERVCKELHIDPARTISIGNSLHGDIIPSKKAGLHTVWIDAPVWGGERQDGAASPGVREAALSTQRTPRGVLKLDRLVDLPDALSRGITGTSPLEM